MVPIRTITSRTSGVAATASSSACSRSITGLGVADGAQIIVHPTASKPGTPDSAIVGTLGNAGTRAVELTPSARTLGAKRTSARACRAPRRGRALARGGFWLCCGRRGLGGYPRDCLLSLFHGPGYVGHQLFQIVLGVFKLRRLCVHFYLPIRRPPQEKGARPQYS